MSNFEPIAFVPGIPLYRQVQSRIEDIIQRNPPAAEISLTDAHLAESFGVSRITVRRAVDELVDAGLLYRIQGVGTFVRPRKLKEKLTLNSFLDSWTRSGGRLDVRVGAFQRIQADRELAARFSVPAGEDLVYVQRLRFQNDALVAIDDRHLRARHCHHLTTQDIMTSSLVDYLRNREKIELDHGEMEIEARGAHQREARILGIKRGQPILVRRVTFFNMQLEPVLAGISTYRADRVSYRVTLSA